MNPLHELAFRKKRQKGDPYSQIFTEGHTAPVAWRGWLRSTRERWETLPPLLALHPQQPPL
jgi:hypothetical protein